MTLHSFKGILSPPTNREALLSNLNPILVQLGVLLRWEVYNLWRHRGRVQALCHVAHFDSHQGNHKRSEELKWWLMMHVLEVGVWTLLHQPPNLSQPISGSAIGKHIAIFRSVLDRVNLGTSQP